MNFGNSYNKVKMLDEGLAQKFKKINVVEINQPCVINKQQQKITNPYKVIEDKIIEDCDFKNCQKYARFEKTIEQFNRS